MHRTRDKNLKTVTQKKCEGNQKLYKTGYSCGNYQSGSQNIQV